MEIHQVVVSVQPGDAITNAALEMRQLLRRIGPSEIFARYVDPRLGGDVIALDEYPRLHPQAGGHRNLLVYHASIGEQEVASFLLSRREELVLVYHNITPAHFFAPYCSEFTRLLTSGRVELAMLRDRVRVALAVSAYNAGELEDLGYRDVRVSPLIVDWQRLRGIEPEPSTTHRLQAQRDGPLVLFVGQLLPHKRPDLLVAAHHLLTTEIIPEARLAIVGSFTLAPYRQAIERFISELNLPGVALSGPVTDEELVAYYRSADLFVTMSEHEGVCIPLIEAMSFGLPIIARRHAAIPETLGAAGLLLPEDAGPALVAEAMAAVLEDSFLAKDLVGCGGERLAAFDSETAKAIFLDHIASVV